MDYVNEVLRYEIDTPVTEDMLNAFNLDVWQGIQSESDIWYKNIQELGTGGNAVTFLAIATSGTNKGCLFAIKVFNRISQELRKDAFLNEVEFLRSIKHPSILKVHDAGIFIRKQWGTTAEYPFVAAEYLPKTLSDVIRSNNTSIPERISYSLQLLSALVYLSKNTPAIIHRDIKPQNIFVKGGSCVLGDFGLMKFADFDDDTDREILKESELPGMPFLYRTPDLISYARKESGITTKSDVFQLGLVLAELFTGWNPAKKPNHILDDLEVEPISHIRGSLGAGIASLIRRMLVVDPNTRESAEQLMDGWMGVMENAVSCAHELEGRAFS